MATMNEQIFLRGTIQQVTKLPLLEISLGQIKYVNELPGVVRLNKVGQKIICCYNYPQGCLFNQENYAIVRVVGDKVLYRVADKDYYDIYAGDRQKNAEIKHLNMHLYELPDGQFEQLKPILRTADFLCFGVTDPEHTERVIRITEEVLDGATEILCKSTAHPDEKYRRLHLGDVFIVEDARRFIGHSMSKKRFEKYFDVATLT